MDGVHLDGDTLSQGSSENTPLLQHQQPKDRWQSRISPASLIIPVAIVYRLATLLPSTTTFYVVRQLVCRLWYASRDPSQIPPDGRMPDALCSIPGVDKSYATALTVMGISGGIASVIAYSAVSFFASRFGRKPAILAVLTLGMSGDVFLIISRLVLGSWLEAVALVLWLVCQSFSDPLIFVFATNMFIVDLVSAEDRTTALSGMSGWATLGGAISFTVGGMITTRMDNVVPVYGVAGAMLAAAWAYVYFILPESFPREKREELRRQRLAQAQEAASADTQQQKGQRVLAALAVPLEPLKQLRPSHNPVTRRRNWRLLYCAVHAFFAEVGGSYSVLSIITFLTTRYNYTPAETGYVLTTLNLTDVFVLTIVIPLAVRRLLRPLYRRRQHLPVNPSSEELNEGETVTEATDHLDVHITVVSWLIAACAYVLLGNSTTRPTQLASVVLLGCASGRSPVFRSLVVATVNPLKQGEALAAIEMVSGLGMFLSPIVMGSILTATISTLPQVVFWVQAAVVITAASVLFLVRDSDRYQKPQEE
ncbi:hypothetical protein AcW1_007603 [Taiwanofungus camphoratus]|nr:hypothetical protein AcW2_007337 [Antrodia cinnamomea]KAI0947363.1 hypothetical protein AcV7_009807 [Antrodia cinnamomea]KAI0953369.1 hypothetical protein AcW1_007603 [Antrodia cinnamomea]